MNLNPKILFSFISVLILFSTTVVIAVENNDKQLLSEKTYIILNDVHELMDKNQYVDAERKLVDLLNKETSNYESAVINQTLGHIYLSMNRYDDALTSFTNSVQDNALPTDVNQNIIYIIAQLLVQAGRLKESLVYLEKWFVQEKLPTPENHIFIASIYYQLQNYPNMIPHVQNAIKNSVDPDQQWYEMLLSAYFQINDLTNAASLLEEMIKIYPEITDYWMQLAATYYQQKKFKKSIAIYKLAHSKNFLDEEGILRLSRLYLNEQLPYQAAKLLDESMTQGKIRTSAENMKLLANSWWLAREYDNSVTTLFNLAKISNDPDIYFNIGQIYFEQEKWKDSIAALERGIKDNNLENKAEAYLLLGIAAYHANEIKRSSEALEKAGKFNKTRNQAQWWLKQLEKDLKINNG